MRHYLSTERRSYLDDVCVWSSIVIGQGDADTWIWVKDGMLGIMELALEQFTASTRIKQAL
jgi:hypothetical protein